MLRRGFKTQAEQISAELRGELGRTLHDPLDCGALAAHLGIPVDPVTVLTSFGVATTDLHCVAGPAGCLSAFTIYDGSRCRIFFNPQHSARRTTNSIAHELSHVILEHKPRPALTALGKPDSDPVQEAEAEWQAGALLVPREGALRWLAQVGSMTGGADHFRVSLELFTWRANQTGVVRQLRYRGKRAA